MKSSFVVTLQTQGSPKELAQALSRAGMRGEAFADPRGFLKRLKEGEPLAGIVDLTGEDAAVMLAMIKSIRSVLGAKLPLIGVYAPSDGTMDARARAAGITDLIAKPLDEDELLDKIAEHAVPADKEAIEVPKLVKWFFEQLSPALAGLSSALESSGELETQIKFYEERLKPHRDYFVGMISAMRKSEAKADLAQSIRMYGIRNTRNLVVAMRLSKVSALPLVGWNAKTGLLAGEPTQALRFATKLQEHFGEGSRNQFEAYNSGLVLDLLSALAESAGGRKAAIRKYIEERFIEAMRQADKCIAAGKLAQNLALDRHIVTTIVMREAGKAAMAIFFPDYLEMRRKFEKKAIRPALQHIIELKQFSVSHNLMGALICQGAPGLGAAYTAVLFFDYPYMLRDAADNVESYDLVQVCNQI